MLVLSRKPGQQIQIGNDVTVTVVKTQGKTVRLGINAPQQVKVLRSELPPQEDDQTSPQKPSQPLTANRLLRHRDRSATAVSAKPKPSAERTRPHRWTVTAMRDRLPNRDGTSKDKLSFPQLEK